MRHHYRSQIAKISDYQNFRLSKFQNLFFQKYGLKTEIRSVIVLRTLLDHSRSASATPVGLVFGTNSFFGGLSKFQKSKFQNFKISESENIKIKISKFRFENPRECQLNQSLTKFQRNRFMETPSRSSGVQVGEIRSRAPKILEIYFRLQSLGSQVVG